MTGFHALSSFTADEWARLIALLVLLTAILGRIATGNSRLSRAAWPQLLILALVWAAIIAAAALAFRNFRPDGF